MKRTHTTTRAVLAGTLGLIVLAVSATGQVRQRNSGQALDANPQVGSGGYNTVVGGDRGVNTQLNRSNRYVTGQVSGLARFRGQVRYSAADQLNLDVPTASSLGGFRRQSVGITDVLGGGAFQTQLYRESSRATLSPRDVRQGQTRSDLLRDRRSLLDTDAGERLYSASRDRYTLMTTRQGDLLATSAMGDLAEDRIPRAESVPAEREGRRRRDVLGLQVSQPGAGALFSVLRSRDRLELARELSAMPMFAREDDAERDVQRDPLTGQPVNAEDRIEQSRQRPYALLGDPNAEGRSADESDPFETSTTRYYLQQNQDVFLEVMARLAEARGEAEVQWTRTTVKRGKQEPRVEFTRGEGLTVRALAGEGKDLFNQNMKRAQSHLKAGRYYDAAGRYELAAVADERNPMARVGMALALTAADETISAAYHLEQAIALYPDIARVRFDLQEMLSKKAVGKIMDRFDERKDREYATRSQAGRLLVQTFFHENLGNDAVAKKLAAKLLENEKASEPAKAYATFVTTGKWPEKTLKESDDGKPEN
jgi:tetratricopeptide (TPR) repeat protein